MHVNAVIFDMDGVIFDSEPLYRRAWMAAADAFGIEISPELYASFVGVDTPTCEQMLAAVVGDKFPMRAFRAHWERLFHDWVAAGKLPLKPGFPALIERLRDASVQLAVASGSGRDELAANFRNTPYLDAFDVIATREDVVQSKPAPDIYLLVASRLDVDPSACLVLEDTNPGASAALAAGMQVVLIPDVQAPDPTVEAQCLARAASLDQVTGVIATHSSLL